MIIPIIFYTQQVLGESPYIQWAEILIVPYCGIPYSNSLRVRLKLYNFHLFALAICLCVFHLKGFFGSPKCPFKALFDAFLKRFIYYIIMFLWPDPHLPI